jgi:hypothetical protein
MGAELIVLITIVCFGPPTILFLWRDGWLNRIKHRVRRKEQHET